MRPQVFSIVITEKGGAQRQLDIESPEVSIGRLEDNDVCLPKSNVSKHHARLVFKDERYVLLDQKSTNGTYVNGRRISAPMVVRKGDKIYIGDFILTLAAPGGTFEGVSAREFRPRRAHPDPLASGPTDPPKPSPTTREDMPQPANEAAEARRAANLPEPQRSAPPIQTSAGVAPAPSHAPNQAGNGGGPSVTTSANPPNVAPAGPASGAPARAALSQAAPARVGTTTASGGARAPSLPPPLPNSSRAVAGPPARSNRTPVNASAEPSRPEPAPEMDTGAFGNGTTDVVPEPNSAKFPAPDANPLQSGLTSPAVLAPSLRLQGALAMLMERLATEMNVAKPEESAFPSEHLGTLERLIDELSREGSIGPDIDRKFLRDAAVSEAVGLGPLDRLLANRSVREVVVDGPTRILADLGGGLSPVSSFFSDDSAVMVVARRLLHRAGRKLDDSAAVQEARLPSGGFLQLLLPPLSAKGPLVTVRCPPRALSSPESLVTEGVLSTEMLGYLRAAVKQRKNILVLGAMGAGVSTLLGALTLLAPDHERVVTIENSPSASLLNAQTLPLNRHARPELSLQDFLKFASRLRHDRLVIDDLSGTDALAALSAGAAMPGMLVGMHAPTPETALLSLELFAQAALGGGHSSLAPLVASALQVLVQITTTTEGTRRVQNICELQTGSNDGLELTPRFRHDGKNFIKV